MKLGTSTECLLGTLEPSATLPLLETPFLNLYLELSLGTSELGTSWNFETFQNLSLEALVAWNLHLKPDLEPLLGPLSCNLATFQNQTVLGTLEPSKPVLGTRVFVDLLDPSLATWNLETLPGTLTENLRNSWGLFLESLLGALEPSETLLKNLCWEPRPSLGTSYTLTWNLLLGTSLLHGRFPDEVRRDFRQGRTECRHLPKEKPCVSSKEPCFTLLSPILQVRHLFSLRPEVDKRLSPGSVFVLTRPWLLSC